MCSKFVTVVNLVQSPKREVGSQSDVEMGLGGAFFIQRLCFSPAGPNIPGYLCLSLAGK